MESLLKKPGTYCLLRFSFLLLLLIFCCRQSLADGDVNCTIEGDTRVARAAPNRNCRKPIGPAAKPKPKEGAAMDDNNDHKRQPRQLSNLEPYPRTVSSNPLYGPYSRYFRRPIRFKRRRFLKKLGLDSSPFASYADD